MSLSDGQWEFAKDVGRLFAYLTFNDYKFTIGEVLRTPEQQQIYLKTGKSKTANSKHLEKKAIDLNIWVRNELTYDVEKLKPIGEFWESLNPKNKAGMFWKWVDAPHYERS